MLRDAEISYRIEVELLKLPLKFDKSSEPDRSVQRAIIQRLVSSPPDAQLLSAKIWSAQLIEIRNNNLALSS
jgi:hypothetical protein